MLYGTLIYEDEKPYTKSTVFEFELTEDTLEHKINMQISYRKSRSITQGRFFTELISPDGSSETSSFDIRNSDSGSRSNTRNRRTTSLHANSERTLFSIVPTTGKYILKIDEDDTTNIQADNIKLKIYKKEEK